MMHKTPWVCCKMSSSHKWCCKCVIPLLLLLLLLTSCCMVLHQAHSAAVVELSSSRPAPESPRSRSGRNDDEEENRLDQELVQLLSMSMPTIAEQGDRILQQLEVNQKTLCESKAAPSAWCGCGKKIFLENMNTAQQRVLIVIPFRDRQWQLQQLMSNLLNLVNVQGLCAEIWVTEQFGNVTFNKGRVMNTAVRESLKHNWFNCIVFHDVDLIPMSLDTVAYSCGLLPRHLSASIDQWQFKLPYVDLVGGVLAISTVHFLRVNGFSNLFWGWGGEDDDLATRLKHEGLPVVRPKVMQLKFHMLMHAKSKESHLGNRHKLLYLSGKRYSLDGLNSLQYKLVSSSQRSIHGGTYQHLIVDVGQPL